MSNTYRLLIGAASRRLMLVGSLAAVLVVALAGPAAAHPGHGRSGLEPPGARVAGLPPGEWVGRWWELTLETPAADQEEPFCASLGRGVVAPFSLANRELTCSVPEGTRVMNMSFANECSDVEEPPYFGGTPRERRACAVAYDEESLLLLEITVDGRRTRLDRRWRAQSPDLVAWLPDDNILGAPAGRARYAADGWFTITKPLDRGRHRIVGHTVAEFDGERGDVTGILNLEVTRRQ
jgi:hypothetical protein